MLRCQAIAELPARRNSPAARSRKIIDHHPFFVEHFGKRRRRTRREPADIGMMAAGCRQKNLIFSPASSNTGGNQRDVPADACRRHTDCSARWHPPEAALRRAARSRGGTLAPHWRQDARARAAALAINPPWLSRNRRRRNPAAALMLTLCEVLRSTTPDCSAIAMNRLLKKFQQYRVRLADIGILPVLARGAMRFLGSDDCVSLPPPASRPR